MEDLRTVEEMQARSEAIRGRLTEINSEFAGQLLPDDIRKEWNELNEEVDNLERLQAELEARRARVEELSREESRREEGAHFNVPSRTRGDDPFDYHKAQGRDLATQNEMLRSQSKRAIEASLFPHPQIKREDAQAHVEQLIDHAYVSGENAEIERNALYRRILDTGTPLYQRAFAKAVSEKPLTNEEQRALGLTNTAGGYAVPYTLDPTILPTSNGAVNPYRRISRVIQIATTTWQGITSAGVTATRRSEADEAADNAPTLAQPSVTPQRVDVFVPFSIEIGQDWQSMQSDLAVLIQDAKDAEEATSFTTGGGTAPAAQGIVTGATTVVTGAGTATVAVADLYSLIEALPPRFLPNAQWVANLSLYNRIRQFDTQGGASLFVENLQGGFGTSAAGGLGFNLLGLPANLASAFTSAVTTGSLVAALGDFRYFAIVDRVGMNIELVSHLFGSNRRPTGQRGFFAYWRNNSRVIDPNAFRVLKTK